MSVPIRECVRGIEDPEGRGGVGLLWRGWAGLFRALPDLRGKGRVLLHWPSRLVRHWPDGATAISREGCVFLHCDLGDYLYRELFFGGQHEPDVDWMCRHLLGSGDVFVDVGACFGYHSLTNARRVGPQGRVYAFEPQPDMFEALKENAWRNGLINVEPENLALSDRRETVNLYKFSDLGPGHTSIARLEHPVSQVLAAEALTLDEYIARNKVARVSLIKLDAEGSELRVIRGARALLGGSRPPIWIVEMNMETAHACGYRPRDLLDLLAEFGYQFYRPVWARTLRKVVRVTPCPAESVEHGQNLLCAIPTAHAKALAAVGATRL